jgi:hypothetical protein
MHHHEAGIVSFLGGMLGYELFGELVVIGTEGEVFLHDDPGYGENDGPYTVDHAVIAIMH